MRTPFIYCLRLWFPFAIWVDTYVWKDNAITKKRRIGTWTDSTPRLPRLLRPKPKKTSKLVSNAVVRAIFISIFCIQMARLGMIDWLILRLIDSFVVDSLNSLNTRDNHTILIHDVLVRRDYCTTTKKIQVVTLYEIHFRVFQTFVLFRRFQSHNHVTSWRRWMFSLFYEVLRRYLQRTMHNRHLFAYLHYVSWKLGQATSDWWTSSIRFRIQFESKE